MKWRALLVNGSIILAFAALAFGGWAAFGPKPTDQRVKGTTTAVKSLRVVGLGDSLTHGVGDETDSGGYVALLKAELEATGNYTVTTDNFGVTGDKANQVQARVDKQPKLQAALKEASIITLTVGGNDLMGVLQTKLLDITEADVTKGITAFQKRLLKLLKTVRTLNPDAPIYVFGIYNPFYVYFPTLTAMTDSVTAWNTATEATLKQVPTAYYVDIDSVLTKGGAATKSSDTAADLEKAVTGADDANPLIFTQDHFHPNNAGYAKMTAQLWAVMQATKAKWAN